MTEAGVIKITRPSSGVIRFVDRDRDRDKNRDKLNPKPSASQVHSPEMDELYRRLQPEINRPKPSPEALSAALEAAQRLAAEADAEQAADDAVQELSDDSATVVCRICGYRNRTGNKFCGMCGIAVEASLAPEPASHEPLHREEERPPSRALALPQNSFLDHDPATRPAMTQPSGLETHHYHHHYHPLFSRWRCDGWARCAGCYARPRARLKQRG